MKYKKRSIILFLLIGSLFFLNSCFDKPNEFVSPIWDVQINLPITQKEYTLQEMVEKDSSLLKSSQSPETLGLIYFGDTQYVSTIKIEDELKIKSFQTSISEKLGTIKVDVPLPAASQINVEDWANDVQSGTSQVFPEQEGNVIIDVEGIKTVENIYLNKGHLTFVIFNNLPVDITLRGLELRNKTDQSVIAEKPDNINEWVNISKFSADSIEFPLTNVDVTNQLEYVGTIYSVGSNNAEVPIPAEGGTTILALFSDLVIASATAQLPSQTLNFEKSTVIDDSTEIERAVIKDGSAVMVINNNMDVSARANIVFENLYDPHLQQYSMSIPLQRNEKAKIVQLPQLTDWIIQSSNPGEYTNSVSYSVNVVTDSTGEISTVSRDDSLTFDLTFGDLSFNSFTGKLKPTQFNIEENGFKLDFGNFDQQLDFESINFQDAKINLNLQSSSNFDFLVSGSLMSTNNTTSKEMSIDDILLPADQQTNIDISDLLNGYSTDLPDSFSLQAHGLINPYYSAGSINNGDSLYGNLEFEIPLNIGIAAATYLDTVEIDLGDVNSDDLEKINYGEVTFTVENSIPVGLKFIATVLDSNNNEILNLPTSNNDKQYLEIPSPEISSEGEVLYSSKTEQTLKLYNDDIKTFVNNSHLKISFSLETPNSDVTNVKFRTSDKINLSVKAQVSYRAEL